MSETQFPLREQLEAKFEVIAADGREERTAALTWYTGAAVRRYDPRGPYEMRFSMEPGAVRLARLASGSGWWAPVVVWVK